MCAEPGPWRNDRAPFQAGIMEAMDDPAIEEVVIEKPAQGSGSQLACNLIGRYIDLDPCAMMLVQPSEDDGKEFLAQKLMPMIESTPALARKVTMPRRGQAGGSTITRLRFPGGFLQLASANAPASLASKSIRLLILDEVDRYPMSAGFEGDPAKLAKRRTRTFWNRKVIYISSPGVAGLSRIDKLYEDSDQRRFHVPCPVCSLAQVMTWAQIRWPEDHPDLAAYHCSGCAAAWDDQARLSACRKGRWIASKPGGKRAGFHFASWITPWVTSLGDIATEFVQAKRSGPEALQVVINTEHAETWQESGEQIKPEDLESRAEDYDAEPMPRGVLALTVGGDTQADRVELEVVGWGAERECWSIDYYRVMGDPDSPALWAEVDALLLRRFRHADGYQLGISAACIDSGGHHTQAVYRFCTPRSGRRVYAIKGRGGKVPIWARAEKRRNQRERAGAGHLVHIVGVDSAKESVYHALRRTDVGPGYCHLPSRYPPEWYEQLASEERKVKFDKGASHHVWQRKAGRPNEAWDCRVYALAALESLAVGGLDLERLAAARVKRGDHTLPPAMYTPHRAGRRVRSSGVGG